MKKLHAKHKKTSVNKKRNVLGKLFSFDSFLIQTSKYSFDTQLQCQSENIITYELKKDLDSCRLRIKRDEAKIKRVERQLDTHKCLLRNVNKRLKDEKDTSQCKKRTIIYFKAALANKKSSLNFEIKIESPKSSNSWYV